MNNFDSNFCTSYLDLANEKFSSLNLTRILDPVEFYEKQYLDSTLPFRKFKIILQLMDAADVVIDMGFGGGFPLLPLAYNYPDSYFVGLDSKSKKVAAVNEIANVMGIENVKAIHCRFEQVRIDLPVFITVKAVGKIKPLLQSLNPTEETHVLFYKGPGVDSQEVVPGKVASWELKFDETMLLAEKYTRRFFLYSFVPRGTIKKKKNLVNLTELI